MKLRRAQIGAVLLFAASAWGQQISAVYVAAPQVRITSGDSMQLSAVARDPAGNVVSSASFQWTSNNSNVLQVDGSGAVTAASLGVADITASAGGRQGVIRVQVLPLRVEVTPADLTLNFGARQQFTAVAYNLQNQPIPDASFAWHVLVGGGSFDSATISIAPDGTLQARTLGFYVVRAAVVYQFNSNFDQFQREFDGSTTLTVRPADYQLTTLASSSVAYPSLHLLGKRGVLSVNDAGTLGFSASLDGLAAGLVAWQPNQGINLLALAGSPGLIPGTVLYDFDNPSIDNQGNVLAQANVIGAGINVILANANGLQVLIPDRMAADAVQDVSISSVTRFSLSDNGEAAVRANFHYPASTTSYQGLLRYRNGNLILEASSRDPLPGLTGTVSFDDQYGLDGNGMLYFAASAGSARAVYQKAFRANPSKVLATGDALAGSTVASLQDLAIASAGDLVIRGILANGTQFLARYPAGATANPPKLMLTSGYMSQLYAANAKGGIVFLGDPGSGYGLYLWRGGDDAPQPVLLQNAPSPAGEPVGDFFSAAVDAAGNVYASVRGVDSPWMLIRANANPVVIASNGAPVASPGNLDLYSQAVSGDRVGPLHVWAGGTQPSIFKADSRGLLPTLLIGDRLPGGVNYTGNFAARKSPSGDLYVTTDSATYRLSASGITAVLTYPYTFPDGTQLFNPYNVAVNDRNQFSLLGGTSRGHQRLALSDGITLRTLAYLQGGAPYLTPSPAGGNFLSIQEQAINDAGLVMVNATVSGGPGGLFVFDGAAWQSVCVLQNCLFDGEIVASIQSLRVSNNKFCAIFVTRNGDSRIDCWESGAWTNLVRRGETTSDGTQINSFGTFDMNRLGDVALTSFTGLNGPSIFVKTAGGNFATVEAYIFGAPDGSYLWSVSSLDLRDDRRVFFIAQDFSGRMVAYEADPLF